MNQQQTIWPMEDGMVQWPIRWGDGEPASIMQIKIENGKVKTNIYKVSE